MTQYEFIEELSRYCEKNYGFTITLRKDDNWSKGFCLSFFMNGSKNYKRAIYFDANSVDWKEDLYDEINCFIEERLQE